MPRGGKREGAGRKPVEEKKPRSKSRAVAITKAVVEEEMRSRLAAPVEVGRIVAPKAIDVMRKNMVFFDTVAEAFLDKAEKAHMQGENPVAIDFFAENARYRGMAQKCAEAIVPYEEPRLTASVPAEAPDPSESEFAEQQRGDRLSHITQRFASFKNATTIEGETVKSKG
jgi:hypothetical protein